ncbi:hypothetical protein DK853_52675, partial [Klebsiella oxytoca]
MGFLRKPRPAMKTGTQNRFRKESLMRKMNTRNRIILQRMILLQAPAALQIRTVWRHPTHGTRTYLPPLRP